MSDLDTAISVITNADLQIIERAALGFAPLNDAERAVHDAWRLVSHTAGRTMAGAKCRQTCQCVVHGGIACELDDEAAAVGEKRLRSSAASI
jgi:hypothetical protein